MAAPKIPNPWNRGLQGEQVAWNKGQRKSLLERLLSRFDLGENDCFEWKGTKRGLHVWVDEKWKRLSPAKAMWFAITGCIPRTSLHLCHTCDNPVCFNISHLFVGTPLDNMRDRDQKGRHRNQHLVKSLGRVA